MKATPILAALWIIAIPAIAVAAEEPVACETMLEDVRAALEVATLGDSDKAKVTDLQAQGIERCKADDDAGADALFAEALAIMGK